jgi:hypothetical protein
LANESHELMNVWGFLLANESHELMNTWGFWLANESHDLMNMRGFWQANESHKLMNTWGFGGPTIAMYFVYDTFACKYFQKNSRCFHHYVTLSCASCLLSLLAM